MFIAGLCWLTGSVLLTLFLVQYLADGAGLQNWPTGILPMSSLGVGLLHFVGFSFGAALCFCLGVGLCAYGLTNGVPPRTGGEARFNSA